MSSVLPAPTQIDNAKLVARIFILLQKLQQSEQTRNSRDQRDAKRRFLAERAELKELRGRIVAADGKNDVEE